MQKPGFSFVIGIGIVLTMMFVTGCVSSSSSENGSDATNHPTVRLNVCNTDPAGADVWRSGQVNLWDGPGETRTKVVGKLAACEDIPVTILDEKGDYLKIKSGSQAGWVLKTIVMGN